MRGMTSERLRAITYDMNTRPNVTITDRYHAEELLAEVKRLREGVVELVSVGYSHTPDCEADDWQRVEYGGHPDCGLCWESKLLTLLNPPTEGETDA